MLFIGQASLRGDITRYAQHFNFLEVLAEAGRLPKTPGLRRWKQGVGADFGFGLRLRSLWDSEASEGEAMLSYVGKVAEALEPKVLLLQTPATATPTLRNRKRLQLLCQQMRPLQVPLAWEPRGVWEPDELGALCEELELTLVSDLSREVDPLPGPLVYTRLLALGDGAHVRSSAAYEVSEKIEDFEQAYVVIEGSGAKGAAKILREARESD